MTTKTGAVAARPSAADHEQRRRLVGIGLMCAALVCFACLDTTAKWLNRNQDPLLTVWARYAVSVALVFLVLNPWTAPGLTRTQRFWLQIGRSVLLLLSTVLNFFALQHLQLAQTISIQFATPFLVALLAGPILGEWIGPRRFAAIAVGFLGVLVVARPGSTHPAMLLTMAGTVCYALYGIATRVLAAHDSSRTTLFYSGLVGVAVMMPLLPWIWRTPPDALTWAGMIAVGALGGFGHWLLILAHARAPAAILSPFIYTQLAWMILLGYLVFGDVPDRWTLAGAGIVVASGLYLLSRERVRKVEPSTPT